MERITVSKLTLIGTPVVLYLFLVVYGLLGTNFGHHWDEHLFVEFADDFHFNGRIIPTLYLYPSFCYYLVLAASIVFRLFHHLPAGASLIPNIQFTLFTRGIFVFLSSLSVIWVYVMTLKITKRFWVAAVAALIFCCSFEFSYHSRWAVSDLIAVQFAFLSTTILFFDIAMPQRILLSAAVAGIAAGTKYTAGIVCLNILITLAVWILGMEKSARAKCFLKYFVQVWLVFGFVFVVTTPGCIYHLKTFVHDLRFQKAMYGGGHLLCDTVGAGWPHFSRLAVYIVFCLFSKYSLASLVISVFVFMGTAWALREKRWDVFGLFFVMLIYVLYVSSHPLLIVRNDLYILPYFAVLAACGVYALHERVKSRALVRSADAVLAVVIAFSLFGVATASWSVYSMSSINMKNELAEFLRNHPQNRYFFSKDVRAELPPGYDIAGQPENRQTYLIFFKDEVDVKDLPPEGFDKYRMISGPQDVNLNYYPDWSGTNRIMLIRFKDANPRLLMDVNLQ